MAQGPSKLDAGGEGRLDLPPSYRAVGLRELRDAFSYARTVAPEEGAGLLAWVRRFDTVEFALVVEPDEPLAIARRAVYAGMNALADAISTHCPPEKPVAFAWPDTVMLDGGILGGMQLAAPAGADETEPPDWLVLGVKIRSVVPATASRDGAHALDQPFMRGTSLESEGFEIMDAAALIGSFARHFMVYVDQWQERGFDPVARHYLGRLPQPGGVRHVVRANGDLEINDLRKRGAPEVKSLTEALSTPQWLDPSTGDPWL